MTKIELKEEIKLAKWEIEEGDITCNVSLASAKKYLAFLRFHLKNGFYNK